MKKLLIMVGMVAAAVTLNAATVKWNSGEITLASGSSATGYAVDSTDHKM